MLRRRYRNRARYAGLGVILAAGVWATLQDGKVAQDNRVAYGLNANAVRVVDGDTIEVANQKYRLLGFDTAETTRAKCNYERSLGRAAKYRLHELINEAADIDVVTDGNRDRYDRVLAHLYVDERNVGRILISEGLARPYDGGSRKPWCNSKKEEF